MMTGQTLAHEVKPGVWIARRYCSRIADYLEAYRGQYVPRWEMVFPCERIEAGSVNELNANLKSCIVTYA